MKQYAAGVLTTILVMTSLACAGAGAAPISQKYGLITVNYDNSIRIGEMTDGSVEVIPGWVIFDDPSWEERFLVPEHKINWMLIEK